MKADISADVFRKRPLFDFSTLFEVDVTAELNNDVGIGVDGNRRGK